MKNKPTSKEIQISSQVKEYDTWFISEQFKLRLEYVTKKKLEAAMVLAQKLKKRSEDAN